MFTCCIRNTKSVGIDYSSNSRSQKEIDYFDFLAPSVYHLQTSFLEQIKAANLSEDAVLYEVEDLNDENPGLIRRKGLNTECPIDGKMGSAYVHTLEGKDHVGTATYMLSYTWGYKCKDIVETLVKFCEDNDLDVKRTYIWICALCNNQHRITNEVVPFEQFRDVFRKRVGGIKTILAMMTPWNDPGYLKRVWCIFEMYSANTLEDCQIKVIMPPSDQTSLIQAVHQATDMNGRNGLDDLLDALAKTKVENAEASWASDKENILRIVEEGPGCYDFNIKINDLLRKWIHTTVFNAAEDAKEKLHSDDDDSYNQRKEVATFLTFCASFFSRVGAANEAVELHSKGLEIYKSLLGKKDDDEDAKELMARCFNNIGTEYESLGKYEEALEMHNKCRETFESIYGTEHENTSVSYFNIGAVYRKLGKTDEALEMYNKSLEIDKKIKGENHIDVALSYSYIGRVFQANEEYEKALEMFEKSLRIREKTYGKNHPDAAVSIMKMINVFFLVFMSIFAFFLAHFQFVILNTNLLLVWKYRLVMEIWDCCIMHMVNTTMQ